MHNSPIGNQPPVSHDRQAVDLMLKRWQAEDAAHSEFPADAAAQAGHHEPANARWLAALFQAIRQKLR